MSAAGRVLTGLSVAVLGGLLVAAPVFRPELRRAEVWQRMASPGRLSSDHAFLENDCAACHTAVKGPDAAKCTACHANNETLLGRQPTAFHADVSSCRECHPEHRGLQGPPRIMDHGALAKIGLRSLGLNPASGSAADRLVAWVRQHGPDHHRATEGQPRPSAAESALNCAACHATKDRHRGYFGADCAECHLTTGWAIAEFRHPSPQSTDCAQCHQAPPSHYMQHFRMVSMTAARQEHAQPNQCFLCHQTTSWNDIKGVGYYKHH
ncbi:MAG: cytochrome c3 family protein [Gemmataceae bacterium]